MSVIDAALSVSIIILTVAFVYFFRERRNGRLFAGRHVQKTLKQELNECLKNNQNLAYKARSAEQERDIARSIVEHKNEIIDKLTEELKQRHDNG